MSASSWSLVVSWISTYLNSHHCMNGKYCGFDSVRELHMKDYSIGNGGITMLNLIEIKKLGMHMDRIMQPWRSKEASVESTLKLGKGNSSGLHLKRPVSSARKQEWINYIHRCFCAHSDADRGDITSISRVVPLHSSNLIWRIVEEDIQRLKNTAQERAEHGNGNPVPHRHVPPLPPAIGIPHRVPNSVYIQNNTINTAHNLTRVDADMDTGESVAVGGRQYADVDMITTSESSSNNTITMEDHANANWAAICHPKPTQTPIPAPDITVRTTCRDLEDRMTLAPCVVCGCFNVDIKLLPCGHLFHEWCLNQCLHVVPIHQVQTCPIDRMAVQSISRKVTKNDDGNDIDIDINIDINIDIDRKTASINNCIDLVSSPDGPSPGIISQIYKKSRAGPFPSKLASILAKQTVPKIKIKLEPGYPTNDTAPTTSTQSESNSSHSALHNTTPRNTMEERKVSLLQQMGFTDMNEMLVGLRHVERLPRNSTTMDPDEHVTSAMLWIVSQREEADEARRIDAVRMESEIIVIEDDIDRNDPRYIMQNFSSNDILGHDYGHSTPSKLFPSSIILESSIVKALFHSLLLCNNTDNQEESVKSSSAIIHLLILEKKVRQWFGSKIPHAFFHHILRGRIETWQRDLYGTTKRFSELTELLLREIRELEEALYSLSQQEEGDLGMMVPKAFLRARDKYAKERAMLSNGNEDLVIIVDDDID